MTTQPEALRLAYWLERDGANCQQHINAAAELRRLSEIETLYLAAMRGRHAMSEELLALTAQRDALLAALKRIVDWDAAGLALTEDHLAQARAAIKAVEENT